MKQYDLLMTVFTGSTIALMMFLYVRELMVLKRKKKASTRNRGSTKKLNEYIKAADKGFSLYIREKFSKNGKCTCYTCGIVLEYMSGFYGIHCGHGISRDYFFTRYDENNARPQCYHCNVERRGRYKEFMAKLRKEIGDKKVDEMLKTKNKLLSSYEKRKLVLAAYEKYK